MATTPTYTDFEARFYGSDLLSEDPQVQALITARLGFYWRRTSAVAWGEDRAEAALLKAAHERALKVEREQEGGRGVTGAVVAERLGKASRQWKTPGSNGQSKGSGADDYWRSTDYGKQFLELRDSVCGSGPSWGIV